MSASKPRLGGIVFVETIAPEKRDRDTLTKFVQRLRDGDALEPSDAKHYAIVLERFMRGYRQPRHRPALRVRYWTSALYWLLNDSNPRRNSKRVAGEVSDFCRDHGISITAATVERAAREPEGKAAREKVRQSVQGHAHCEHDSVIAAHRVGIEERILAWHRKEDDFRIPREHRITAARK